MMLLRPRRRCSVHASHVAGRGPESPAARTAAGLLVGVAVAGLGLAGPPADAAPPPPPPPPDGPTEAEPEPPADGTVVATIADAGLELRLPPGSILGQRETPAGTAITAIDGGSPPGWSLLVQEIPATVSPPLPRRQLEELLSTRRQVGGGVEVLEQRRVQVDGRLGHVVHFVEDVSRPDRHVALAVFLRDVDAGTMILVSARARDAATLDGVLDDVLAGVRLRDGGSIAEERSERLEAGGRLLRRLSGEDELRELVGSSRWYRTYRVDAASGDEIEVGCMLVEVLEGLRGTVDATRDPRAYSMADREPGLLVRVTAQFPVREGLLRTSQAVHWMAWDQSSEQWSVRATVSDGRRTDSEALTGVRAPRTAASPRGSITVVTARERGSTDPPAIWPVPDVLLSQPIRWMLGELLVRADAEPGTYAWYAIDASDGRPDLSYREDRWRPATGSEAGAFVLESRPRPTSAPTVSVHDDAGRLVRRVTPEGIRTEPIELEALHRLWRSKGLPTGPLRPDAEGR